VLHRIAVLVTLGVAAGTVVSVWTSRLMAALLYSVSPRDPAIIVAAVSVLTIVAALATWAPARRAAGIDPAVALRRE
jgi:ABC-type antimicrobial peptide transport system permease subunit